MVLGMKELQKPAPLCSMRRQSVTQPLTMSADLQGDRRDGSVGKALAEQAGGLELRPPDSTGTTGRVGVLLVFLYFRGRDAEKGKPGAS